MALDMAKYRRLFLEEAAEHLGEMGHALLELEKDTSLAEPIDTIFRMAHSIKSMAASLGYDSVTEVSHALEDHMEVVRAAGRVGSGDALSLLFRGLEGLEQMVAIVSETGESPPTMPALVAALSAEPATEAPVQTEEEPPSADAPAAAASYPGEPPDAAELDVELAAVMAALEAESGAKKKLLN
jgi:two-component system chemotaxis sensor kinase CheA